VPVDKSVEKKSCRQVVNPTNNGYIELMTHTQIPTGIMTASDTFISVTTDSSFVSGWSYEATEKTMLISFKDGRQYFYAGVPVGVVAKFIATDSVGKTFNAELKGKYEL